MPYLLRALTKDINQYRFDVAISFAGENRDFAEAVANSLKKETVKVFYDKFYKSDTWGQDLSVFFRDVFWKDCRHCIMILSDHYVRKKWPILERKNIVERYIQQRDEEEYLLPVRLDGFSGEVPGLPGTVGYIEATSDDPGEVTKLFLEKWWSPKRRTERLLAELCQGSLEQATLISMLREKQLFENTVPATVEYLLNKCGVSTRHDPMKEEPDN